MVVPLAKLWTVKELPLFSDIVAAAWRGSIPNSSHKIVVLLILNENIEVNEKDWEMFKGIQKEYRIY